MCVYATQQLECPMFMSVVKDESVLVIPVDYCYTDVVVDAVMNCGRAPHWGLGEELWTFRDC